MAAWRAIPSAYRGALIGTVGVLVGASSAILITASGLVDSQIPDITDPAPATVTAAPAAAADEPSIEPVPPAPRDRFGDSPAEKGWIVGVDVLAGKYRSPSPQDGEACTWSRLRKDSGQAPTQRSTDRRESGESVMTVRSGDLLFTSGCEEWVRLQ
jgi:hypothetical protein